MHQKITAKLSYRYPAQDQEVLYTEVIKVGKDLSDQKVEAAMIQFLANTDFVKHLLYDFEYEVDSDTIQDWMRLCRKDHQKLTPQNPAHDESLTIGTFKSDHRHTEYANLHIIYEQRYLENE